MRHCAGLVVAVCAAIVLSLLIAALEFSPSAVPEPGRLETFAASTALRILVWRQARREAMPSPPGDRRASLDEGDKLYGVECADCHGDDGRSPTDEGRWMYPRAANLVASQVQRYSDRELFSIVKNGVRLSGMPAFEGGNRRAHLEYR